MALAMPVLAATMLQRAGCAVSAVASVPYCDSEVMVSMDVIAAMIAVRNVE